jgi:DNA-3-methyladenine glycosylase II
LRLFYRAFGEDALLGGSIRDHNGMSMCGGATLFEAIVTSILAQQINLKFAYSIYEVLARRYGERLEIEGEEFISFPTPERVARVRHATLRNLKLSNAKAGAIHRIAKAFAKRELEEVELDKLEDEDVIERLVAYKGIGRWTAETAMLRGLGRLDVFPAGDLGVVKKIALEMLGRKKVASEEEMRTFSKRWSPYRSLALIYAYATLYKPQPPTA